MRAHTQNQSIIHFPVKEKEKEEELEDYRDMSLLPKNCGSITLLSRITRGTRAALMEFPWMAQLIYHKGIRNGTRKKFNFYKGFLFYVVGDGMHSNCAGTLVNDRYILTAAHCVFKKNL